MLSIISVMGPLKQTFDGRNLCAAVALGHLFCFLLALPFRLVHPLPSMIRWWYFVFPLKQRTNFSKLVASWLILSETSLGRYIFKINRQKSTMKYLWDQLTKFYLKNRPPTAKRKLWFKFSFRQKILHCHQLGPDGGSIRTGSTWPTSDVVRLFGHQPLLSPKDFL